MYVSAIAGTNWGGGGSGDKANGGGGALVGGGLLVELLIPGGLWSPERRAVFVRLLQLPTVLRLPHLVLCCLTESENVTCGAMLYRALHSTAFWELILDRHFMMAVRFLL